MVRSASYLSVPYYRRSRIMLIFQGQCFRSTCEKKRTFQEEKVPMLKKVCIQYVYAVVELLLLRLIIVINIIVNVVYNSLSKTVIIVTIKNNIFLQFQQPINALTYPKPCHCGNISLPRYPISIPSCQTLFTLHTHLFIVQMTAPL